MKKNSTLHYVVNNFDDADFGLFDLEEIVGPNYEAYEDVYNYLDSFKPKVRDEVIQNILKAVNRED